MTGTATLLQAFERDLAAHVGELLQERLAALRAEFAAESWVNVGCLLREPWLGRAREEAWALLERRGVRRDVAILETGNSPRRLRNVRRSEIAQESSWLPALYRAGATRALVAAIAGNEVALCPYVPEQFVLASMTRAGDTHGWHWDDYTYSLVFVIDAPPPDAGGDVEYLPGVPWEKERPRVDEHLASGRVRSRRLESGEAYLIKGDTTLHRVAPLKLDAVRVVYAMAYAHLDDLSRPVTHETTEALYR